MSREELAEEVLACLREILNDTSNIAEDRLEAARLLFEMGVL